jgi:polyadenylate-binding protein
MYPFQAMSIIQPPFGVFNKLSMAPPLYVGDLDENIHDETLHDFFSKFGPLHFVRIMRDPTTGKSRGFGYVNFLIPRDAESAKNYAQYEKLGRKQIRIMFKRNVRDLPLGANIFVKNLDHNVTSKDLHNHFNQVGGVVCAKVATNSEGQSLGYGYVQFEKKEDADAALETLNGSKLKETEIQLFTFVSKDKRAGTAARKNIYVKHLPLNKTEEELNKLVEAIFSPYGEIETKLVKKHPKDNKYSAFICFKDEEAAHRAVETLTSTPQRLEGAEADLYVAWHQGRAERGRELKRVHQQAQNNTNLYVKNLKPEVSENDLKSVFQQFGTITSVACKDWISNDGQKKARCGFIAFDNAGDTQRAQIEALENPDVRNLYLPEAKPYIGLHQSKENRKDFLVSQRKMRNQQNMMGMDPSFRNMPQMPMAANRRFPPYPPMMNSQQFRQPMSRGGPRTHRGGWNRGPNQQRGGAPRPVGGRPPMQQHPHSHQQHQQQQQGGPQTKKFDNKPAGTKPGQPQGTTQAPQTTMTVQSLRSKIGEFLSLDTDKQRQILGELLFPLVKSVSGDNLAPKITGMLIDLSVLEVTEILEFLENPALLEERVTEAMELIQTEGL